MDKQQDEEHQSDKPHHCFDVVLPVQLGDDVSKPGDSSQLCKANYFEPECLIFVFKQEHEKVFKWNRSDKINDKLAFKIMNNNFCLIEYLDSSIFPNI